MKKYMLCALGIVLFVFAEDRMVDIRTPRAALETIVQGICNKDMELCLRCVVENLKDELIENWDENEMPGRIECEILDEDIDDDVAMLRVKTTTDIDDEEVTEEFWFIKDDEGWKLTWGAPDEYEHRYDSMEE